MKQKRKKVGFLKRMKNQLWTMLFGKKQFLALPFAFVYIGCAIVIGSVWAAVYLKPLGFAFHGYDPELVKSSIQGSMMVGILFTMLACKKNEQETDIYPKLRSSSIRLALIVFVFFISMTPISDKLSNFRSAYNPYTLFILIAIIFHVSFFTLKVLHNKIRYEEPIES